MSCPKRERLWNKWKTATKIKQVDRFRKGLGDMRSTIMLGLMYQKCVSGFSHMWAESSRRLTSVS